MLALQAQRICLDTMSTQTLLWAVIWAICTDIDRCPDIISTSDVRNHGRANIKLFENPAFHGFHSTLDGEMKQLNATGNYINKNRLNQLPLGTRKSSVGAGVAGGPQRSSIAKYHGLPGCFFFTLRSGNHGFI